MWGYLPLSLGHLDLGERATRLAWRVRDVAEPVRRLAHLVESCGEMARRVGALVRLVSFG
jgi:hypothetical protein